MLAAFPLCSCLFPDLLLLWLVCLEPDLRLLRCLCLEPYLGVLRLRLLVWDCSCIGLCLSLDLLLLLHLLCVLCLRPEACLSSCLCPGVVFPSLSGLLRVFFFLSMFVLLLAPLCNDPVPLQSESAH